MLQTKCQGHRPSGSGEDLKGLLPYMAMWSSWSCDQDHLIKTLVAASYGSRNLIKINPVISMEKMFEKLDGLMHRGWTSKALVYY